MGTHLLEVKNLKKTYPLRGTSNKLFAPKEHMIAVNDMSFYIEEGEIYGSYGRDRSGKTAHS